MKRLFSLTFTAIPLCVGVGWAVESASACQSDCLAMERIGQDYYVVARDSLGEIVTLDPVQFSSPIPRLAIDEFNAKLISVSTSLGAETVSTLGSPAPISLSSDDGSIETIVHRFDSGTEVIVVTITIYKDDDGNVVDIDVNVSRFTKNSAGPDDVPP